MSYKVIVSITLVIMNELSYTPGATAYCHVCNRSVVNMRLSS